MLSKVIQLSSHPRTIKLLASLIIILVVVIGMSQWKKQTDNSISTIGSEISSGVSSGISSGVNSGINSETKLPILPALTSPPPEEAAAFSLSQWTINLVEQLYWHKEGSSSSANSVSTIILFLFLALATSLGLPRQIAALVAGINLGALFGVVVATLATTLGCLITFSVARYLFSDSITRKYPQKLATLSNFLGQQTFLKALVIRILPLGSNFITNIIAGVSKVPMPAYVSGSFVGFIPQMVIFSLAGSGMRLGAQNELIASVALFIIALILSAYLVKKHKAKKC